MLCWIRHYGSQSPISRLLPTMIPRNPALLCSREGYRFMNKADFVQAIADRTGLTQTKAGESLDATIAVISEALAKGDDVKLPGFGTFQVVDRAATEGRHPRTGEKIAIAASKQPKFKPGIELKRAVGGNG
jgi:DNA-binding protein HU-beta